MTRARSVTDVHSAHIELELECLDRIYLNGYVPLLQGGSGAAYFYRNIRGNPGPVLGSDGTNDAGFCGEHRALCA